MSMTGWATLAWLGLAILLVVAFLLRARRFARQDRVILTFLTADNDDDDAVEGVVVARADGSGLAQHRVVGDQFVVGRGNEIVEEPGWPALELPPVGMQQRPHE